jgi:hypothetical protein
MTVSYSVKVEIGDERRTVAAFAEGKKLGVSRGK